MNILAFLYHTFLSFTDANYRLIRATLPTRKTFFDDLRALTRYMLFPSWDALMDFMMRGLGNWSLRQTAFKQNHPPGELRTALSETPLQRAPQHHALAKGDDTTVPAPVLARALTFPSPERQAMLLTSCSENCWGDGNRIDFGLSDR